MSFGYAIGDFLLLTQIAWNVVQNSRKACGAHDELTSEVTSLHIVLRRLQVEVSKPNSILTQSDDSLNRIEELAQLSSDCRRVLKTLDGILEKYNALSEEKRGVMKLWKRVQFRNGEMLDLADLRLKVSTSTSALTLFLNMLLIGSQGKVESYMESQGDELRQMRRSLNWITAEMQAKAPKAGEGSILTTYAGDDKAVWKDFRRELLKEGFSCEVLQRHKQTIKDYVMELGSRGALDDIEDDIGIPDSSSIRIAASDGEEYLTEDDEVETSGARLPEGSEEGLDDPQKIEIENDTEPPQTRKEQQSSLGIFKFEEEEEEEEYPANPTKFSLYDGEVFAKAQLGPAFEVQKRKGSDTDFHEIQPLGGTKANVSVDVPDETEEAIRRTTLNFSGGSTVSPNFVYDPDSYLSQEYFSGMSLVWFGPYRLLMNFYEVPFEYFVPLEHPLFPDTTVKASTQARPSLYLYRPDRLCHWLLSLAHWYDQTQLSTLVPASSPTSFSYLALELRLLLVRVCVYHTRMSHIGADSPLKNTIEDVYIRCRWVIYLFYFFIRRGIRHILSCKQSEGEKLSSASLWMLDDSLGWQPQTDTFVSNQEILSKAESTRSLYKLDDIDSISFLHGVFKEDMDRSSRHATPSSDGSPRTAKASFIAELQIALVSFKRWCEEAVLQDEARREPNFHRKAFVHTVTAAELRDPSVANAAYNLKMCNIALETWSFQNDYHKNDTTAISFSRHHNSLSAILERCDEAQEKLYRARQTYHFPVPPLPPVPSLPPNLSTAGKQKPDNAPSRKRKSKKKNIALW